MTCTHVIFDLDGTLLNTLDDLAAAANHTCKLFGWPTFSTDAYRLKAGNGMPKLIERFMPPEYAGDACTFRAASAAFHDYYDAHKEDSTAPYVGVPDMLAALRRAGLTLAVLSNKDDSAVKPLVSSYFEVDTFAVVQGRIDALPAKPAAPLTLRVLERLEADPARTLYVGDSDVDVATGHNAGIAVVGAEWGFRGRAELVAAGADFIAHAPEDIVEIAQGFGA